MLTSKANKMSWRRGQPTAGWAALNLGERRKGCPESSETDAESYPSLLSSIAPPDQSNIVPKKDNGSGNYPKLEKPFVSVVLHTVNFPALAVANNDSKKDDSGETLLLVGDSSSQEGVKSIHKTLEELSIVSASEKLMKDYPWADKSLTEDVLAGINNNLDEASRMLKAMESSFKDNDIHVSHTETEEEKNKLLAIKGLTLQKDADVAHLITVFEEDEQRAKTEMLDNHFPRKMPLTDGADTKMTSGITKFCPIEPELEEEDDLYLVHRKPALRKIRSASHYSKAANDAYLRGDYLSAKQYSLKAQEEWIDAERLNAEAAKEILSIRNCTNDPWTLDLHGLHAAEAIQALHEHLQKIEFQVASANRSNTICGLSPDPFSSYEGVKGKELPLSSRKPTNLEVITGKGNHSRGQAALPAAIRSFLIENGYHFDETRPGVIGVRPKFRRG